MNFEQAKRIVGFGEALIDVLPSGEVVGGAPLNFAFRASELARPLGWQVSLATRIGIDPRGEAILDVLKRGSVDLTYVQQDRNLPTGYVDIRLQAGQADYEFGDHVAWDNIQPEPSLLELAKQANAVCFGTLAARNSITRATLETFLDAATGAVKVLDINLRKPLPSQDVIRTSLTAANVLKCNEDELQQLAQWLQIDSQNIQEVAAELIRRHSLRCVFLTRGEEGCQWQDSDRLVCGQIPEIPSQWRSSDQSDTVGAGDAATAALVIGLLADWTPQRIIDAANLCGAFAAHNRGPTTPAPQDLIDQLLGS